MITGLRLGGAETQLLLLAKNIKKAGNDVMVVAMESGGTMAEKIKHENIPVVELGILGVATLWSGYQRFKAVVKSYSPDVIHAHMIHANLFSRIYSTFNHVPKLISTAHNIVEGNKLLMSGYYLTRSVPDWSTNVSREAYERYVNQKYFIRQKSSFVPNAIDTDQFYPNQQYTANLRRELRIQNDAYIFFSAGRLHMQKNHAVLLRAFAIVRFKLPHAILLIAGEGPLENELRLLCKELSVEKEVQFIGRRDDMPALMNLCDCFVLSSDFEGFGLVVGEAMATLKSVVATNCGGVKEVMGGFGELVEVKNTNALAAAMLKVNQQPCNQNYLIQAKEYISRNYAVPAVVNQWIQLYSKP